ncbi:hypothetical protein DYBT9275_01946 [Dyadobacter sp. CECT 9275]|uniref:RNA polymerase sigma-70 factor, ECF subfamily n=1 Tax=Dyadobacter helix TaxID=2822344 RepID=A0A916JB96_9BACT|nr:sigma-70 family RNA polymerase sigma factor [Dyadobacter sp. CECT 9275]CAG4998178.1 hypothetical protein DYBT9275_01946 [Dyadobacter sp. CECT 9275]
MTDAVENIEREVDHLYRHSFGKMVASLMYFSKDIDLETAEDLVQDSFATAFYAWQNDGIPTNPGGWIFTVCRNKAINKIKASRRTRGFYDHEDFETEARVLSESVLEDQQLKMLFACANDELAPKVQVVITLKYVVNLKVEAISKILGMSIDGVDKLLLRARQKIRNEKILLTEPDPSTLAGRLPIVHKMIYLLFNEGYKSSWGKEILREELCEEALILNKSLLDSGIGNKETAALHSLMLFNAARFKARFGSRGELLDLEEQDRSLWNRDLIMYGAKFMAQSRGGRISQYQYEATIAYLHCIAKDFQTTDWSAISDIYKQLLQLYPNPFVELSYAISLYYAGQKGKARRILHDLKQQPFLNQYYLLNATLGKISLMDGNLAAAKDYFEKTIRQTDFQVEKDYVQRLLSRIALISS